MFFSISPPSPLSTPPRAPPNTPNDTLLDIEPRHSSLSMASLSCAFPSWPNRSSLFESTNDIASAYISDEDLFLEIVPEEKVIDDVQLQAPYHRVYEEQVQVISMAQFPLRAEKPTKRRRRRSSKKSIKSEKPMSPIPE
ncbi:MAG: hypothetical protein M1834_007846 [Cirrosporium novae-zelandiae]|nr:MAG: hypothetical protein M1834_007846 [Cirrosporium novae-zelandiae]